MSRRVLIIVGHPDPHPDRFCRRLAEAYAEGAGAAGHKLRRIDLATIDFPMLRTNEEFQHGPVPESLKPAADAIAWAEHIVFVFPLWLGTMPSLLKAFLEQTMRPGIAFAYPQGKGGGFATTLLKGRSARLVVTMGMPAFFYRILVSRARGQRHAPQHPQLRRDQAGSRDPVRRGGSGQRRQAQTLDRADAPARRVRALIG